MASWSAREPWKVVREEQHGLIGIWKRSPSGRVKLGHRLRLETRKETRVGDS